MCKQNINSNTYDKTISIILKSSINKKIKYINQLIKSNITDIFANIDKFSSWQNITDPNVIDQLIISTKIQIQNDIVLLQNYQQSMLSTLNDTKYSPILFVDDYFDNFYKEFYYNMMSEMYDILTKTITIINNKASIIVTTNNDQTSILDFLLNSLNTILENYTVICNNELTQYITYISTVCDPRYVVNECQHKCQHKCQKKYNKTCFAYDESIEKLKTISTIIINNNNQLGVWDNEITVLLSNNTITINIGQTFAIMIQNNIVLLQTIGTNLITILQKA